MTRDEYRSMIQEVGLTEDQRAKLVDMLDAFIKKTSAGQATVKLEARANGVPPGDLFYYLDGKGDGLNLACKLISGTLGETDELE